MGYGRRWGGAVAVLGVAILASGAAPAPVTPTVSIKEFKFAPAALSVPRGAMVKWVNHDEEVHTVTSGTGAFGSGGLSNEETFTQTFERAGTYQYFCALHPQMRATIVVR